MVYTTGLLETMITSVNAEVIDGVRLYWPQEQMSWFSGTPVKQGAWLLAWQGYQKRYL